MQVKYICNAMKNATLTIVVTCLRTKLKYRRLGQSSEWMELYIKKDRKVLRILKEV